MAHNTEFDPSKIKVILATDCGSTTSKARFFKKIDDEYRYIASGEAPTTVEFPYEDVTLGVRNAIREVEELTGHRILADEGLIMPSREDNVGTDLYVTTSSAGGGLQMIVIGLVKIITATSAERAALGAGAIVMDVVSADDSRRPHEQIERIRFLRPDMILFAGGTDYGASDTVIQIAEILNAANPRSRLGKGFKLPTVYAGNIALQNQIKGILNENFLLTFVDNIRPTMEKENSEPSRQAVHRLFMEHVMSHAPGYDKLMKWTPVPIMPTPAGEGMAIRQIANMYDSNAIGVGLGGATTNIYSVYDMKFLRTVSANLGMSYSICNTLKEAGIENVIRWTPFKADEVEIRNKLRNKMIRPTTIPETLNDLIIEHALAREAIRLGFQHHKQLAVPLRGVGRSKEVSRFLEEDLGVHSYLDMMHIGWIAGTGGLLSHAPRRAQSMLILIDSFQPEGITKMAQDSVFMMPHLGVLSTVHPKASMEIFEKDCLILLGTCIALRGNLGEEGQGKEAATMEITMPNGDIVKESLRYGKIKRIPLSRGEVAQVEVKPTFKFDVGAGHGRRLKGKVEGGAVGIVIDARGRPLRLPKDDQKRRQKLIEWHTDLNAYPEEFLEVYGKG